MSDGPPAGPGPAPRAVPLPPGYELVGRLGAGGFASVWLAEQGRLGRKVAVKILTQSLVDAETERRFLAECRAVGRLSGHPAVVTVHDAGTTDDGHPYLVMEHLPGGSLQDRLRNDGLLPWAEVVTVGVHVADALAAAHEAGILHRDVKPANVLLDASGAPRLGDFGIARLADAVQTATGVLVGTIPFTPPEVLMGEPVSPAADVWSLGVTLHTLLTGTNPFVGERDEAPAVSIGRVLRCEVPPLPPAVPAALRDLLVEMVDADPGARPDGAVAVVGRLQAVQRERGLPVTAAVAVAADSDTPTGPVDHDATAVGLVPPPSAGEVGPSLAKATPAPPDGGVDPNVATVAGPRAWTAGPDAAPVGDTAALAFPAPVDGAGPTGPKRPTGPTGPTGGAPPPAPPPRAGRPPSRSGARLLIALAVVVVLVLVAGIVAALVMRDGDDDTTADGPGVDPVMTPDTAGRPGDDVVDSPVGAPIDVPSGASSTPTPAWDLGDTCRPPEVDCVVMGADGDLMVLHTRDGARRLTRVAAESGEETASVEITGPTSGAGLARIGGVLVVAGSGEGGERVYRAMDPDDLEELWSLTIPGGDGPVFPGAQLSDEVGVIVLRTAEHIVVDLDTGEERRDPGRVLATDRQNVYAAVDDRIVARDLHTGATTWDLDVASSAPGAGEIPAWRHGVVHGTTLVVTSAEGDVIGIDTEGGAEVWRHPLSADGAELGRAVAVAASGDRVVVVGETGDLGVEPRDGGISWRVARDRLVLDPELDRDRIAEVRGQPVWIGQQGMLIAGWAGVAVRAIDTADGSETAEVVDFPPSEPGWSTGVFAGGLAVLGAGSVRAFSTDALAPLWTLDAPGATAMVPIDRGVALLGPDGVQAFRD